MASFENSWWRTAAILKMAVISEPRIIGFRWNLMRKCVLFLSSDEKSKFSIYGGQFLATGWLTRNFEAHALKHVTWPAVRSVTLNLANKFSQCTFSVTEHYDLFSDLIILRQAWWRRTYDVIPHRPHRSDRETAAGKLNATIPTWN